MLSRRKFLASSAISLLSTSVLTNSAVAWRNAFSTASPIFNGGRSQVNFNSIQNGGDYPFLNCMLTGQGWRFFNSPAGSNIPVTPDLLSSTGWPVTISNGGIATVFFVPSQTERPGRYVIFWTGNGSICVSAGDTLFSGSKTAVAGVGRYEFTTTTGGPTPFTVGTATVGSPTDFPHGTVCCHVDDESSVRAGRVFGVKFKQRLTEANFGVIRFLNWQFGNTTNVTTWSTRRPVNYPFYQGSELRPALYAGLTANVGNAYTTTSFPSIHSSDGTPWTSGGPKDKDTIIVNFNASATQSGTCSMDIGNTGSPVNMLNEFSNPLSVGSSSYPIAGTNQSVATLVFDAVLNAYIKQGGDAASGATGINSGAPVELMFQLCAEIGAHPYFISPPLACTPMTDWHTGLATYGNSIAPAWMIPRYEGPNELWNTGSGFYQTIYAQNIAIAYGWGSDYQNWMGKAMSTIGQALSAVYGIGNLGLKYHCIVGVQTGTGGTPTASNPRLLSTKYLAQTPQANYSATAARLGISHVCCSQYLEPTDLGLSAETTLSAAFGATSSIGTIVNGVFTANSTAFGALAIGQTVFSQNLPFSSGVTIVSGTGPWVLSDLTINVTLNTIYTGNNSTAPVATYLDTCNSGAGTQTLNALNTLYEQWFTFASGFQNSNVANIRLCGYEGGYGPVYTAAGTTAIDIFRYASKQLTVTPGSPTGLTGYYTTNMNNFAAAGGEFVAEFQFSGKFPTNNAWSVLENIYQTNPPQWNAIVAFNH